MEKYEPSMEPCYYGATNYYLAIIARKWAICKPTAASKLPIFKPTIHKLDSENCHELATAD